MSVDLTALGEMIANLDAYIERRAAELAQPLIDEAREAAATGVKAAQREQQRAEDLATELRRQRDTVERHNTRYRQRAEQAEKAILRGLAALQTPPDPDPDTHEITIATWRRGFQACADHVTRALNGTPDLSARAPR